MLLEQFAQGHSIVKQFLKGELIYRQDNNARYFYEVKSGEVKIVNSNEEGKEFIQGVYKPGDCFGVAALICEKPYTASAIAFNNCELFTITREQFFQLMKDSYSFHFNITQIACRQLLYKTMMLEEIAIEEGEHRLLTLIHYLMAQKAPDNKALDTTKQQLADMTGLRVETVIRIMKNIEEKGMIATRRGMIVCLSKKK